MDDINNNINIKLFKEDKNEVAMPSIGTDMTSEQEELISDSIDTAIGGEQVKVVILKEVEEIAENNYIFDFTDLQSINVIQKEALKSLVSNTGNVQLYLYKKGSGLTSFGMGDRYNLELMVPLVKNYVFNDEVKVYKNYKVGERVKEVIGKDITKMRLHL